MARGSMTITLMYGESVTPRRMSSNYVIVYSHPKTVSDGDVIRLFNFGM